MGKREPSYNPVIVAAWFRECGLPEPVFEYRFHPTRKWRFDIAFPSAKVAVEVEGGVWTKGRHTRPSGFRADMEKYNAAAVLGWRVLRVEPKDLCMDTTVEMLKAAQS
jgi:very-short-patch-repair endonuclease